MVRLTHVLARVPVIKFRKGGAAQPGASAVSQGSCPAGARPPAAAAGQVQPAAAMSTGVISDIDLPARYRRTPLSQEEIDHINGGGIV